MRYAIDKNGNKVEAEKGVIAYCPLCKKRLIAKCGSKKIKHWAHDNIGNCDRWYEYKTKWHIDWQDCFNKDYQEVILYDEINNEKHIADVCIKNKLIIEFQHSFISSEECKQRELFYTSNNRSMIWIVDGSRLKNDFKRFKKNSGVFKKI